MKTEFPFSPNWISHPGSTIKDVLVDKKVSNVELAQKMNLDIKAIELLLSGKLSIDDNIAYKLESTIGSTKAFWLSREE